MTMWCKKIQKYNVLFVMISFFSFCQKPSEKQVVESFLYDVYSEKKSLNLISEEYRYKYDDEEKANEKFIKLVQYLQIDKKYLYSKIDKIKVEPLNQSKIKGLWTFEKKEGEIIYVVIVDGEVDMYALIKDAKIVSFVYIRKGSDDPAHFIPYWDFPLE